MGSYKLDVYKKGSYLYTVATWKLYWTMITLLITFLWLPPLSKQTNHMQFCMILSNVTYTHTMKTKKLVLFCSLGTGN